MVQQFLVFFYPTSPVFQLCFCLRISGSLELSNYRCSLGYQYFSWFSLLPPALLILLVIFKLSAILLALSVSSCSLGSLGFFLLSWCAQVVSCSPGPPCCSCSPGPPKLFPILLVLPSCHLFSWSPMLFPVLLVPHVVSYSPGPPNCFLFSWSPKLSPILLVPHIVSYSPGPPCCFLFSWSPKLFSILVVPQIVSYSPSPIVFSFFLFS